MKEIDDCTKIIFSKEYKMEEGSYYWLHATFWVQYTNDIKKINDWGEKLTLRYVHYLISSDNSLDSQR